MSLQHNIKELVEAGIISVETGEAIQQFYTQKQAKQSGNRLLVIFGVIGALLVGLGIILILAHNWDNLSVRIKTVLAFLPLLVAQSLCAYTLLKQKNSVAWRESSSTFLFFCVAACMALVSQIYNMPGNFNEFVFMWMLLCLPLVYLMPSSFVSLAYIVGSSHYILTSHFNLVNSNSLQIGYNWLMLLAILPHYFTLIRQYKTSNFTVFHHWFVAISFASMLLLFVKNNSLYLLIALVSLGGVYYQIGHFFKPARLAQQEDSFNLFNVQNAYSALGTLSGLGVLLFFTFKWAWQEMSHQIKHFNLQQAGYQEIGAAVFITILALFLTFYSISKKHISIAQLLQNPHNYLYLIFIGLWTIAAFAPMTATFLTNILVLIMGVLTILEGVKKHSLRLLNYGLLLVAVLVIARFFDTNLSFIVRGVLFVLLGLGFFFANYFMLHKNKIKTND